MVAGGAIDWPIGRSAERLVGEGDMAIGGYRSVMKCGPIMV